MPSGPDTFTVSDSDPTRLIQQKLEVASEDQKQQAFKQVLQKKLGPVGDQKGAYNKNSLIRKSPIELHW